MEPKKTKFDQKVLRGVERMLQHRFKNASLLETALTHASVGPEEPMHNERLEFLGDAILGMVICHHLYLRFPEVREGELTRIKSSVVSRRTLARLARKLGLGKSVRVGKGMAAQKSLPASVLANVYEALVAALYLDGGLDTASAFILRTLKEDIENVVKGRHRKNYKSMLQHLCQAEMHCVPIYRVVHQEGPDHLKTFEVEVTIEEKAYGKGYGSSKKEAEQQAARAALEALTQEGYQKPSGE